MFFRAFVDLIFPSRCLGCQASLKNGGIICLVCFEKIPVFQTLFCGACSARLPENKKICHRDFFYLLGAASNYQNAVVRELIQILKFKFIKNAGQPLAQLGINYLENLDLNLKNFVVMPVPLSKRRQNQRGFNQSELIAKIIAGYFNLPFENQILYRVKNTRPQTELKDFEARQKNLNQAFRTKNQGAIFGKNILLVDDVTTSGATFLSASQALKEAGAKNVIALAIAKA